MVSLFPRRLRDKLWPEPLPSLSAFEGQTVLVTGATGGLGLAAAVHFASFGATVILTSRSLSQGNVAKDVIEQRAGIVGQEKVHVMELNMSEYSSCLSFVDRLKQSEVGQVGLDVAVLNAGLINVDYVQSPEGWYVTCIMFHIHGFTHASSQGANDTSTYSKHHTSWITTTGLDEVDAHSC